MVRQFSFNRSGFGSMVDDSKNRGALDEETGGNCHDRNQSHRCLLYAYLSGYVCGAASLCVVLFALYPPKSVVDGIPAFKLSRKNGINTATVTIDATTDEKNG